MKVEGQHVLALLLQYCQKTKKNVKNVKNTLVLSGVLPLTFTFKIKWIFYTLLLTRKFDLRFFELNE